VEIVQQIAAILFVFALLGAALWWLRGRNLVAFGPVRRGAAKLQVIEHIRLTPQHTVHIVRVGDRELTIAAHPSGCTLLQSQPAEGPGT
jgi:flagellar biogenesis protein FliO